MKKIIKVLIITICIVMFANLTAFAHAKPDKISVNDFSGVISDGVKEYIAAKNDILFEKAEAKIIFVTTESTEGLTINEYTQKLYKEWDIGYLGRKNSIFVVIDTKKSEYSFARGKNIRYAFPDSEIYQYFVTYFESNFTEDAYDKPIMALYNAFGSWYESHYNDLSLGLDENINSYIHGEKTKEIEPIESKVWICISLVICGFILIVILKIKRNYELKVRKSERRRQKRKHQLDIDKIAKS